MEYVNVNSKVAPKYNFIYASGNTYLDSCRITKCGDVYVYLNQQTSKISYRVKKFSGHSLTRDTDLPVKLFLDKYNSNIYLLALKAYITGQNKKILEAYIKVDMMI